MAMYPPEKPNPIPNEIIFAVYRALGIGILDCRTLLTNASPLFYARFVEAVQTQGLNMWSDRRGSLHDPIEDQPEFDEIFQEARKLASAEIEPQLSDSFGRMGRCHLFWHTQKRILREKYGIEWFPPSEMNPHILFD